MQIRRDIKIFTKPLNTSLKLLKQPCFEIMNLHYSVSQIHATRYFYKNINTTERKQQNTDAHRMKRNKNNEQNNTESEKFNYKKVELYEALLAKNTIKMVRKGKINEKNVPKYMKTFCA